jgi:dTDP-4-dehydrorhamnose 3,5-epimerase
LLVPAGCAHGFVSTRDGTEVIYVASEQHAPEHEDGLRFDDPMLAIHWPVEVVHLSEKDSAWAPAKCRISGISERFAGVR